MRKLYLGAFGLILATALMASGCSNTPDTVEDPLSAFGIDTVLPFATIAPEAAQPTPTVAPEIDIDSLTPADYGQGWKSDNTVTGEQSLDDSDDDFFAPQATPKPTPRPQAAAADYVRLSSGDSSTAVRNLQNRLKALNYYSGTVDGQFGSGTVTAVKKFQSILGYDQTGVATVELQRALFASNAPKYVAPAAEEPQYVHLSNGDSGTRVTRLQNRLKTLGYYTGTRGHRGGDAARGAVRTAAPICARCIRDAVRRMERRGDLVERGRADAGRVAPHVSGLVPRAGGQITGR